MPFDFKKEYKEFYAPPKQPRIVKIPPMQFAAVRGGGDPNEENGEYQQAIPLLYGVSWTIRMSHKGNREIAGFFEYTVPPLEGLWWQEGVGGADYACKRNFQWISLIRLPDFVRKEDFDWATAEAARKKNLDFSRVELFTYHEGLCVQCMHIGSYDQEPATVARMDAFAEENGFEVDISSRRRHHELYLSNPSKTDCAKMKTIIRHPIRPAGR